LINPAAHISHPFRGQPWSMAGSGGFLKFYHTKGITDVDVQQTIQYDDERVNIENCLKGKSSR